MASLRENPFLANLTREMKRAGVSQRELARKLGVTSSALGAALKKVGKGAPWPDGALSQAKVAEALGVEPADIEPQLESVDPYEPVERLAARRVAPEIHYDILDNDSVSVLMDVIEAGGRVSISDLKGVGTAHRVMLMYLSKEEIVKAIPVKVPGKARPDVYYEVTPKGIALLRAYFQNQLALVDACAEKLG